MITVGIGARLGNGLLLSLLSLSLLQQAGARWAAVMSFCACSTAAYGVLLGKYLSDADSFRFGNEIVHQTMRRLSRQGAGEREKKLGVVMLHDIAPRRHRLLRHDALDSAPGRRAPDAQEACETYLVGAVARY